MAKSALQKRIDTLVEAHGSLRKTAKATGVDLGYLWRMRKGLVSTRSDNTLKKLGMVHTEAVKPLRGISCE